MINGKNKNIKIAQELLLNPYNLTENYLNNILNKISADNEADIYFQYIKSESWALEEQIVKVGGFSINKGFGLRAVSGEKTAFSFCDDINEMSLLNASKTVKSIQLSGQNKSINLNKKINKNLNKSLYKNHDPIISLDNQSKIDLLYKIDQLARIKDEKISQVMINLASEYNVILIARNDGLLTADIRPLVRLSLTVIAEQNGRREVGSSGGGGRFDLNYFNDEVINSYIDEAVNQALINLEAKPAPAGEMSVILGSGWPGILLHEAVGHGLEGDFNRKGSSSFSDLIGQQVASKNVTILDDGTLENRRGSLNIDDEGNPTQANVLIENGILKSYMQDSLNARLMKTKPTGNGRRESYAHIPLPRMTNTYMLNGDKNPEEIISSLKKGIYAKNFSGGQVDITSGKFVFSASQAFWVENGKILYPIKGATLIGHGPSCLKKIKMLGNDLSLDSGVGTCGKDGQSVPVGVGQPTMLIEGLTVGGVV